MKINDRNINIAVRVFHSAKIDHIHSVCSYLHGHEHTKYTESVCPLTPEINSMSYTVTHHCYKDEKEDEFCTKINK